MNISYTNWIISLLCLKPVINDFPYSCYKHWNPYLDRWRLESSSLYFPSRVISISDCLMQGSPTPGLQAGTGPRPVRNRAAQQEVSGGRASEASSAAPHRSPSLALPPEPSLTPPHPLPCPWKNCLPWNWSLVPKSLGTAALGDVWQYLETHLDATTRDGECYWYLVSRFLGMLLNILQCVGQPLRQRITWHKRH